MAPIFFAAVQGEGCLVVVTGENTTSSSLNKNFFNILQFRGSILHMNPL